ncbi:hypothetical protein R7P64_01965 [Vibrio sp. 2304]|uniref:hypothetical protein n=1 Tax=Vibrio TaxID=662 RepID=UPI002963E6E7|nr:hypothetical protein [Vibrio sp. 2304]MDW1999332.1 hypothetical protein [Vibrio sp. 2304]
MESIGTEVLNFIISYKSLILSLFAVAAMFVTKLEQRRTDKLASKTIMQRLNTLDAYRKKVSPDDESYQRIEDEINKLNEQKRLLNYTFTKRLASFFEITYDKASILLSVESIIDSSKKKTNTVVGMMLKERASKANRSSLLLVATVVVYLIFCAITAIEFSWLVILFPCILLFAFQADQYLITFRIRKGWYGRNEYEAREIIEYILSHADKDDFNDEGGLKKLMDDPERVEDQETENLNGWVKA